MNFPPGKAERFRDRAEAGARLAGLLAGMAGRPGILVLGLPRGGVPVAFEAARALRAPLDVFVVRKLGLPGFEELAMGAIASGGVRVLNPAVVEGRGIKPGTIEAVAERELAELRRREAAYRGGLPPLEVRGREVILVDDGIATGSSMRAGVQALRQAGAARIVAAAPVAARSTAEQMRSEVDELAAVLLPEDLGAVGAWYDDFSQTSDAEVQALLRKARHRPA